MGIILPVATQPPVLYTLDLLAAHPSTWIFFHGNSGTFLRLSAVSHHLSPGPHVFLFPDLLPRPTGVLSADELSVAEPFTLMEMLFMIH